MKRKVDPDEFRRLHADNWTREALAAHFGVTPDTVTRTRQRLGLAHIRRDNRGPRKVDLAELRRLHDEGKTRDELAAHFGVAPDVITRNRKALGLPADPPRRRPAQPRTSRPDPRRLSPERLARIESLLDDGWSFKEIRRTEGVSMDSLRKHFPGRQWSKAEAVAHTKALRYFGEQIAKAAYAAPVK